MHIYRRIQTDLGDFWIACSPCGVTAVHPAAGGPAAFEEKYRKRFGLRPGPGDVPAAWRRALQTAASGRPPRDVPVDWSIFTGFQEKVLRRLLEVPRGQVRTYAWLARRAGNPRAARAVGNALARNPIPLLLPCHRIVPASGGLGNYGLGSRLKGELLLREGADIAQGPPRPLRGPRGAGQKVCVP